MEKKTHQKKIWDHYENSVQPKHSELREKCQEHSRHTVANIFYLGLA